MKENKTSFIYLISILFLILLFTRFIIGIDIVTNNKELYSIIENELDKIGIRKYTLIKNDKFLLIAKETILQNQKEKLEWLNIERKGMRYIINIEPKIDKNKIEHDPYCNIISTKDAIITRVISSKGVELKEVNDSVKKGDILIGGDIKLNEETKDQVCANGVVYGKTWYTINITIPKTYTTKIELEKKRYNIEVKWNNKKYTIFKPRMESYNQTSKKIISIFGLDLNLKKEIETKEETKTYTEEEIENNINRLVKENMDKTLKGEYKILEQKVLKKQDNNSTIDIEIFIVAEEQISESSTEKIEEPTE